MARGYLGVLLVLRIFHFRLQCKIRMKACLLIEKHGSFIPAALRSLCWVLI